MLAVYQRPTKGESDRVKICQRKIKEKRLRWRVRQWDCSSECTGDPEKKENNGLSGLVLVCASLISPFLFLLSIQGQRSFNWISGDGADRRDTHSSAQQTSFISRDGSVNTCIGTHIFSALLFGPSLFFKVFARTLPMTTTAALLFIFSKIRTSLFPGDVTIKFNHSNAVYFPFRWSKYRNCLSVYVTWQLHTCNSPPCLTCHLPPVVSSFSDFLPFFSLLPRLHSASRSSLLYGAAKFFFERIPISDHTGGISEQERGRWDAKVGQAPFYEHGEGASEWVSEWVPVPERGFEMSHKLFHLHSLQTPEYFNFRGDGETQRYNWCNYTFKLECRALLWEASCLQYVCGSFQNSHCWPLDPTQGDWNCCMATIYANLCQATEESFTKADEFTLKTNLKSACLANNTKLTIVHKQRSVFK